MRILICGAGIAGLSLAFCLERLGHSVDIVERAPQRRDDGYMIDFFGSGYDAMERLGLLPDLAAIHEPVERLVAVDTQGRRQAAVPYEQLRRRLLADRHFNFMRGALERVLGSKLTRSAIRFNSTVASIEQDGSGVSVGLTDGTTDAYDLLVGADGVHSLIRTLLFSQYNALRRLGYQAAAYVVDAPPPALDIGRDFVTVTAPHRQVSLYQTGDGRLATFFLYEQAGTGRGHGDESVCGILQQQYAGFDWIIPDVLECCYRARRIYFDHVEQVDLPSWSQQRVVLIGDACQCLSPLGGQGASMAVAGAYILASLLHDGTDVTAAVAAYERMVKPVIKRQQAAARRIARWFVPISDWRIGIRNVMMQASVLPPIASVLRRRMAAQSIIRS